MPGQTLAGHLALDVEVALPTRRPERVGDAVDVDDERDARERDAEVGDDLNQREGVGDDETDDDEDRDEEERPRDEDGDVYLCERLEQFEVRLLLGGYLVLVALVLLVEERRERPAGAEDAREVLGELLESVARRPPRGVFERGDDVRPERVRVADGDGELLGGLAVHLAVRRERLQHLRERHPRARQRVDERDGPRERRVDAVRPRARHLVEVEPASPVADDRRRESEGQDGDDQGTEQSEERHLRDAVPREEHADCRPGQPHGTGERQRRHVEDDQQDPTDVDDSDGPGDSEGGRDEQGARGEPAVGLVDVCGAHSFDLTPAARAVTVEERAEQPETHPGEKPVGTVVDERETDERHEQSGEDERDEEQEHDYSAGTSASRASSTRCMTRSGWT